MPTPNTGTSDGTPSYIVEEEPAAPAPVDMPKIRKRGRDEKAPAEAAKPAGPALTANQKRLVLAGSAMLMATAGLGLFVAALLGGSSGETPVALEITPIPDPAEAMEAVAVEAPAPEPIQEVAPEEGSPADSDEVWVFKPDVPKAPRRLPHRAVSYTHPPPGGHLQWEAIQAARNNRCSEALDTVAKAMEASIDHAGLYSQAWFCFMENHQRALRDGQGAKTWQDFPFILDHFEGPPEQRDRDEPELAKLPRWFWPAAGGLEYRLEAWENSSRKDKFVDVMADLRGEPTATDELLADVWMEANAAVGLSKVEDPNDKVVEWWARRVYVTARALNGRTGRLIESHRPEALQPLRDMLAEATTAREPEEEGAKPIPVPDSIMEAYNVGMGLEDAPDPLKPRRKGPPPPPKEPDLDALIDDAPLKVYK